jgi:hypothetical protein
MNEDDSVCPRDWKDIKENPLKYKQNGITFIF